ncbi:Uncharacterized protein FWK35_00003464 [Aphis craccivora]|uniref:Uncharacterized protein n=1 Tax=Aphis craccivora TaxID=307492 RepID=A0A6G0ZQQ3_APHCR|nr:Uncharacterized protein FWK35_00003464 [Aphis craccivora]
MNVYILNSFLLVEERPKHSVVNRNPPGCQASRRISRTSRRSSSIGCRSLMIGRRSSAGLLAWTSCQDPSRKKKNCKELYVE